MRDGDTERCYEAEFSYEDGEKLPQHHFVYAYSLTSRRYSTHTNLCRVGSQALVFKGCSKFETYGGSVIKHTPTSIFIRLFGNVDELDAGDSDWR